MEKQPVRSVCDIQGRDITPEHMDLVAKASIVRGLSTLGRMVDRQQRGMYPDGRTILDQFDRTTEERRELFHEVVQYDGSEHMRKRVGEELADNIISLYGIATVAAVNLGPYVVTALSTMCDKYDLRELCALRERGFSQEEAVARRKALWKYEDPNK